MTFPLNEDEIFYKQYHKASQSPETLRTFLEKIDKKTALQRQLIVPELFPEIHYETNMDNRNISISRYNRYTPAVLHKHSYFEIVYIFNGHCTQNIGSNRLYLQTGDVMVTAPENIHTIEAFNDDIIMFEISLKYKNIYEMFAPLMKNNNHIISKFFAESLHDRNPIKYLLFHTGDDNILRSNILKMSDDQKNFDDYTEYFLIGQLMMGFTRIMRHYSDNFETSISHRSNLPDDFLVMKYIQENLATISLNDVAERFNFSVSHCSRLIKAATGFSFNEWKRILRMKRAQFLLTNTTHTITEIANAIGYANPENFIRTFEREFNLTPTQYRRRFSNGQE